MKTGKVINVEPLVLEVYSRHREDAIEQVFRAGELWFDVDREWLEIEMTTAQVSETTSSNGGWAQPSVFSLECKVWAPHGIDHPSPGAKLDGDD